MKPSIGTTALLFVVLGAGGVLLGLTGFPKPTLIASGAAAGAVGLGLFFRLRLAWSLGMAYALVGGALSGYRLYHAWQNGEGYLLPAVSLALDVYLCVSLLVIRSKFAKPTSGT